jgi:DNA-directed RNA polymerase specialized sigma24 family protein
VSDDHLAAALFALREASDPSAPRFEWAWRAIAGYLARARPAPKERDRDDICQRALLKVLAGVRAMEADTPVSAIAWLKTVYRSAFVDHFRGHGDRELDRALNRTPKRDDGFLERIVAPEAEEALDGEGEDPDRILERAKERVHVWLAENVARPSKRLGDYRRAEIALLANVFEKSAAEIRVELGLGDDVETGTIYKWIERGREDTLLPAFESWDDRARAGLVEVLVGARRSDSGKPRPERRRAPSVSSGRAPASEKRTNERARGRPASSRDGDRERKR